MMMDLTGKHIVVLGYAPSVRMAPWSDKDVVLFGLNDQPFTMPRVDVLFELHSKEVIKVEGHWDKLKALSIPIFMQDRYEDIPNSIKYPLDSVAHEFNVPGTARPYLTCSASEMLAVAIMCQPSKISLFGIDMAQNHEFREQRPSCEFWLGIAKGRNIEIEVQPVSDLLQCRFVYGFEEEKLSIFQQQAAERNKWLQDQLTQATNEEATAREKRLQYQGALSDMQHVTSRWTW